MLASFPEKLKTRQAVPDNLAYLGAMAKTPEAAIVKLPNISAPLNQLEDCIRELRDKGYDIPIFPKEIVDDEDIIDRSRYNKVGNPAKSQF